MAAFEFDQRRGHQDLSVCTISLYSLRYDRGQVKTMLVSNTSLILVPPKPMSENLLVVARLFVVECAL